LRFDAAVVGGGTAGANAAYQLARRGMSVGLIERRPVALGGAQWHNGVLAWQFELAGLAPPEAPERVGGGTTFYSFGPDGSPGPVIPEGPIMRADMGLLGERLRALAGDAGVEVLDGVERLEVEHRGDRLSAVEVVASAGTASSGSTRVEADLFVDASGRAGALRRRSPVLAHRCPPVRGPELCAAGDFVVRIDDRAGAERFLARHGARPGDHVNQLGTHGGWSTRSISVSEDLSEAGILVGCIADGRFATVPTLMADARRDEPWLGETVTGGTGVIPLRRPYAHLTAPGLALVGDAACQVFPVHGSGIGLGLIAGTMLAGAVCDAADAGSRSALWRYQFRFHRRFGPGLAMFDGVRRMTTALGSDGVTQMIRAGLMSATMTRAGLDQRLASPPPGEAAVTAGRLAARPRLAAVMVPGLARAQTARMIAARYPVGPDEGTISRWDERMSRALGPLHR
jgi:halogenation protein CepH